MSQLEYLIVLVSILVGLGLADLVESFRDLVLPERNVQWHGLPVTWSMIVLGYVLAAWWTFYELLQSAMWHRPLTFLPVLLTTLSLYLLCAFALPDADREDVSYVTANAQGEKAIDLETFYLSPTHRRWFFGTAATFSLLFIGTVNVDRFYGGARTMEMAVLQTLLTLPILTIPALVLITTRRKWVPWALTLYSGGWVVYLLYDVGDALVG